MAEQSGKHELFDDERSAVATAENIEGETVSVGSHSSLTQGSSNDNECASLKMEDSSGQRKFFDEERSGRAAVTIAENVEEGEISNDGSRGNSNDNECVNPEIEDRPREHDIGGCNIIDRCILRTRHPEDRVSYHNFRSCANRPTLSESANPREIVTTTIAIAEAAEIAAQRTLAIVRDLKDMTGVLQFRVHCLRDKARRMLRQRDRYYYNVIATGYEQDLSDALSAGEVAEFVYRDAFQTVNDARNAAQRLSDAINTDTTETAVLEEKATTAFAFADRATILCYHKQYSVLIALEKCLKDLITPVFPRCEFERWEVRSSSAILLVPTGFIVGLAFSFAAWFGLSGNMFRAMFGLGLFVIGITVVYALCKLTRCLCTMRARKIRNDELQRDIEDIDMNKDWLRWNYMSQAIPPIPLNEG